MGIFSKIGAALKDPEVQDRLASIGGVLQGDTDAAQAYHRRSAQRMAAETAAARLEALAQAEAEAEQAERSRGLPNRAATNAYDLPGLAPDGPTAPTAPPVIPVGASQLPQVMATPAPAPASAAAPSSAAPQPRSIYAEMLPQLIRASGRGADVSGLLSALQTEDYIRGLAQKDQAAARAVGPANFANWERADNKPIYNETTPGNTWGRYDPETGIYSPIYTAPARAEPVTTERVIGAIVAKRAQGLPLTNDEQAVYDRWENGAPSEQKPPGTSQIVGAVLEKVRTGGVESLTPGEQAIWERYNRGGDGLMALLTGAGYGAEDDEELPAPAAPARLPQKPAKPAASTAPPPAFLNEKLVEGVPLTISNGKETQVWTKRNGVPVRLK